MVFLIRKVESGSRADLSTSKSNKILTLIWFVYVELRVAFKLFSLTVF
jgi:hypothetical protein